MNVTFFRSTADLGQAIPLRRPRLVARWRRAADGKLECRWKRADQR